MTISAGKAENLLLTAVLVLTITGCTGASTRMSEQKLNEARKWDEQASDAFEAGNYALVRREATELCDRSDDEALREAAFDLRRRIAPDPTSIYLWALGVALLVFQFGYHLMQSH